MIKKLSRIFGSKTKAQEVIFLQQHLKEVLRQGYYPHELSKVEHFCTQQKIFLVKSEFKVILQEDTYSNYGQRLPEKDPREGMYFVYFSYDEEKAYLAAYYELVGNDRELGLLLGYPECCVKFYCEHAGHKNLNPEHRPTNGYTNLTKRGCDAVLLSHFPCFSDCAKSIELAKKNLNVLQKIDPPRAREMQEILAPHFVPP